MQIPPQITFHNMDPSPALTDRIREKLAKLDSHYPNIVGCQVVVESAHHHKNKGRYYSVRVHMTLPGGEMIISHHPGKNPRKHDKVFAAMNNAFDALNRKLTSFKEIHSLSVKAHEVYYDIGVVSNYFPEDGYGFLATKDGTEVYFHQNTLEKDRFLTLEIGTKVRFVLASEPGRKGPQATFVQPIK